MDGQIKWTGKRSKQNGGKVYTCMPDDPLLDAKRARARTIQTEKKTTVAKSESLYSWFILCLFASMAQMFDCQSFILSDMPVASCVICASFPILAIYNKTV